MTTATSTKNSLEYASISGESMIILPENRCIAQMGRFQTDHGSTDMISLPMCA